MSPVVPFVGSILGCEPSTTVVASSAEEVAAVVARADTTGEAVIPWGGGTGQAYGYLPRRADVLLDLSRMNRIVAVEPGDLTITVEAGATLADVQAALAQYEQFLPLDPPDADRATIGGILATNAFGPSRPRYGTARDWLIGLTVVDAGGRLVRGGGKVVKNVTGYDTPKMHVGALGTLGVIVEATFKVAPRPDSGRAVLFALPLDAADVITAFLTAVAAQTAPALSLMRDMAGERVLALIFSGMAEVVESEYAAVGRIADEHGIPPLASAPIGMDRPFRETPAPVDALILHLAGPPAGEMARHAGFADRFGPILHRLDTFPGSGQTEAILTGDFDPLTVAREALAWVEAASVSLAFWQAPPAVRDPASGIALWSPQPPALPLMRRLKETLDPNGTMNPGRFIGGL